VEDESAPADDTSFASRLDKGSQTVLFKLRGSALRQSMSFAVMSSSTVARTRRWLVRRSVRCGGVARSWSHELVRSIGQRIPSGADRARVAVLGGRLREQMRSAMPQSATWPHTRPTYSICRFHIMGNRGHLMASGWAATEGAGRRPQRRRRAPRRLRETVARTPVIVYSNLELRRLPGPAAHE